MRAQTNNHSHHRNETLLNLMPCESWGFLSKRMMPCVSTGYSSLYSSQMVLPIFLGCFPTTWLTDWYSAAYTRGTIIRSLEFSLCVVLSSQGLCLSYLRRLSLYVLPAPAPKINMPCLSGSNWLPCPFTISQKRYQRSKLIQF